MKKKEFSVEVGGQTLHATFSNLTEQCNGSVIVKMGETSVLATACMGENEQEGIDWFPLTVDYEEKYYAAGKILGGRFMKREGRPSEEAVLTGRIVDRTIRPLFNNKIRNSVQVILTVLSIDKDNDPDILSIIAASLALATSDIPWRGPVSATRICILEDNTFAINPSYSVRKNVLLDLVMCGKEDNINMIEAGARECPESMMKEVFDKALLAIKTVQEFQEKIVKEIGKEKKDLAIRKLLPEAENLFAEKIQPDLFKEIFSDDKKAAASLSKEWVELHRKTFPDEHISPAIAHYEEAVDKLIHTQAIEKNNRADGRKMNEVRSLFAQAGGVSSVLHGTGIFYRGGTHVLSVLTLGGPDDAQLIEGMEVQEKRRFMHHYNFPPYSAGECGRVGGTNRREIGHGALAERALSAILPTKEDFPQTIRLVSESMASNGSTSMASVCASCLALMDGGVPITAPIAGIAIGLMMEENTDKPKYKILTDIQGPEDHYGDMDFKVAGTKKGIAAIQMDVKVDGIDPSILLEAFDHAKIARDKILEVITKELKEPRSTLKDSAPCITSLPIKEDRIGLLIGPGGKNIKKITEDTGAQLTIEQEEGKVYVIGKKDEVEKAKEIVLSFIREYKQGDKCMGTIVRILDFGAIVELGPGQDGLVHVSEIAPFRIDKVTDVLKEGQQVPVVVKQIEGNKMSLSIKMADKDFIKIKSKEKPGKDTKSPF